MVKELNGVSNEEQITDVSRESEQSISPQTRSTASYYYWVQRSATYTGSEYDGGWISHGGTVKLSQGQSISKTITYTSTTIGFSISVSKVVGAGFSVTPGTGRSITTSINSGALSAGTYQPQYIKRRDIYSVVQDRYLYDLGTSTRVSTQTGTVKFAAQAQWRFVRK